MWKRPSVGAAVGEHPLDEWTAGCVAQHGDLGTAKMQAGIADQPTAELRQFRKLPDGGMAQIGSSDLDASFIACIDIDQAWRDAVLLVCATTPFRAACQRSNQERPAARALPNLAETRRRFGWRRYAELYFARSLERTQTIAAVRSPPAVSGQWDKAERGNRVVNG